MFISWSFSFSDSGRKQSDDWGAGWGDDDEETEKPKPKKTSSKSKNESLIDFDDFGSGGNSNLGGKKASAATKTAKPVAKKDNSWEDDAWESLND